MATVTATLQTAATHLNDSARTFWDVPTLTAFLQEAHRELSEVLYLNGLPVIHAVSLILNFPANAKILSQGSSPSLPANIITPVKLFERDKGGTMDDFVEMQEKSFLPLESQDDDLNYWAWIGEQITFIGANSAKDLMLEFDGSIPLPVNLNDTLGFIDAEDYIAPRTAALASGSIGKITKHDYFTQMAEKRLDKIIRANVKNQQSLPVRRRPYRRVRSIILGR